MKKKNLSLKIISNKSGIGILQILLIISITATIGAGIIALVDNNKKSLNAQLLKVSTKLLTDTFNGLINDDMAWRNTTANNPNMGCIYNGTNCAGSASSFTPFVPYNIDGTLFLNGYNPNNPSHGFSPVGDFCTTYSATTPTNRCPLRYTFTWQPICPASGPCVRSNIRIRINAVHTPESGTLRLNTTMFQSPYSTDFVRGIPDIAKAQTACQNINYSWDNTLLICRPQAGTNASLNRTCPNLTSYDALQRPNGVCACPVRCPAPANQTYNNVIWPNPYSITVTCTCNVNTIN